LITLILRRIIAGARLAGGASDIAPNLPEQIRQNLSILIGLSFQDINGLLE
jgi:hypothetical protein